MKHKSCHTWSYSSLQFTICKMRIHVSYVFLVFLVSVDGQQNDTFLNGTFPPGFLWGVGTSSYQVEGAWNQYGKGPHIWDTYTHENNGTNIADGKNGDVACESYHKFMEDIVILREMGVDVYRISISWGRIIPNGTLDEPINQAGIAYYRQLINALVGNGIKPMVTIYCWELPQHLQDIGGWPNEALIDNFARYARVLFTEFGKYVKDWITFNEPWTFCHLGYGMGVHAPGIADPATQPYLCGHTVIKAHAVVYRIYEEEFKATQGGQVGITLAVDWNEPAINDSIHTDASDRLSRFTLGWFAHPLYFGEYPPIMRTLIDEKSIAEGRNESRLPSFDSNWTRIINQTLDFLGVNHYTSVIVIPANGDDNPGWDGDSNTVGYFDEDWEETAADWLRVVPWGFRKILKWLDKEYNHPPMYVTENGYPDAENATAGDPRRVNYFQQYINEMMKAVVVDGVDVKGYIAWTLMDTFEWGAGYTQRFGIHHVNYSDPNFTRVPKRSAMCLKKIFEENGFPSGPSCSID